MVFYVWECFWLFIIYKMSNGNNNKNEIYDLVKKILSKIENEIVLIKKDTDKIQWIEKNVQSYLNYEPK